MSDKLSKLSPKFQEILTKYINFVNEVFEFPIIVLFGSSALGKTTSDLDICTLVDEYSRVQQRKLVDFTIDLHRKYSLKLDFDVPYENKLIYSKSEIKRALTGWQYGPTKEKFIIPPIIIDQSFLASPEMKDRLLINILTTNVLLLNGQNTIFSSYSHQAWETLIKVIFSYNENKLMDVGQLVKSICQDPYTKENKKHFLGYDMDNKVLIKKIKIDLNRVVKELYSRKILTSNNEIFCIDQKSLEEFTNRATIQKRKFMV